MLPPDITTALEMRIETIRQIIEEVFRLNQLPISAWDSYYMPFIDALEEIDQIASGDPR